jgi:hypothetical protein
LIASHAFAAQPKVTIAEVMVDFDSQTISIMGENFDIEPNPTTVSLGGLSNLNITTNTSTQLVVDLPVGIPEGVYTLAVSSGPGQRKNDQQSLTVGAQGPQGDMGDQGDPGPAGANGAKGPEGNDGADGLSAVSECGDFEVLLGSGDCLDVSSLIPMQTVFISSITTDGDILGAAMYPPFNSACGAVMSGVEAADFICQELASSAGLTGTFNAWISDSDTNNAPVNRFFQSPDPYVRVDGVKIVDNWADLIDCNEGPGGSECLDNPLNVDENGITSNADVWTNTNHDGLESVSHCIDWTSSDFLEEMGNTGISDFTEPDWTEGFSRECDFPFGHLYCFEQ